jgi:ABC-type transporter Mla subunit MlaD
MTDIAPLSILLCAVLGLAVLCLAILRMAVLERRADRRPTYVVTLPVPAPPRPTRPRSAA